MMLSEVSSKLFLVLALLAWSAGGCGDSSSDSTGDDDSLACNVTQTKEKIDIEGSDVTMCCHETTLTNYIAKTCYNADGSSEVQFQCAEDGSCDHKAIFYKKKAGELDCSISYSKSGDVWVMERDTCHEG